MFRTLTLATVALFLTGLGSVATAAEPNSKKILGTWQLIKSETLPDGYTTSFTFGKDGAASTILTYADGRAERVYPHQWVIDGDTLTITTKALNRQSVDVGTIVKMTETTLIVRNLKGREDEFKRLK